jgi:hypothetical protein
VTPWAPNQLPLWKKGMSMIDNQWDKYRNE